MLIVSMFMRRFRARANERAAKKEVKRDCDAKIHQLIDGGNKKQQIVQIRLLMNVHEKKSLV